MQIRTSIFGDEVLVKKDDYTDLMNQVESMFDSYVKVGNWIIEKLQNNELKILDYLNIPRYLANAIITSWDRDDYMWHSNFRLAGNAKHPKLLSFNADTPTMSPTSLISNGSNLKSQLLDTIGKASGKRNPFIVVSSQPKNGYLDHLASMYVKTLKHAGFHVKYVPMNALQISNNGVYDEHYNHVDIWIKCFPWVDLLNNADIEELMTRMLNTIYSNSTAIVNPIYTLMFESKMMMTLIPEVLGYIPDWWTPTYTASDNIVNNQYVVKKTFSSECRDTTIKTPSSVIIPSEGLYSEFDSVYQEIANMETDSQGRRYLMTVDYAWIPSSLVIQRTNDSYSLGKMTDKVVSVEFINDVDD